MSDVTKRRAQEKARAKAALAAGQSRQAALSAEQALKQRKRKTRRRYIGIGVAVFALILWVGLQPLRGTIKYGICRTYVEQHVPYPQYLRMVAVLERALDARLDYLYVNEFGENVSGSATCIFGTDPSGQLVATAITVDRIPVEDTPDDQPLTRFNRSIPAIIANKPDTELPPALPDKLDKLWQGTGFGS